ncbi:alpha/beta hydrolase [Rhizobium leguminosarum]|uniref:alpha/beta fold hydrolase n=1 Tax=Rhizobium leguminosarum TaxID=384 RepID=UPI001C93D794|nr:alpha/beta hydrolase [Rhizobium leguminosarum]MBY5905439.1 alpha/beta hydrolase [Rhizobium leguminosarum]MBY5910780.1 alpha/beta hydrolase [Rhizobium leguminosarum]
MTAHIEAILGRYVNLAISGAAHRIYFEEAGQGRPVLCLHTAGADTRQWRFVLNDPDFTNEHHYISFDMPWHGKSLPPEGFETAEYLLTTEAYIETILSLCDALKLDRPLLAGCSMGGRIALQLAALYPDRFSGFVAIEASDFQSAWYDIDWFDRPDAHGGEMGAALVSANIAPQAPKPERWNTQWMFMQSGPGVFRGDLSFYTQDDSLIARLGAIDTTKTPVHIMCGEYDMTCTPEDARRTAEAIQGATLAIMKDLGHFPMSENPKAFKPYFMMALKHMAASTAELTEA